MSMRSDIETKVRDALAPVHLEVVDESHMHSVPAGAESHFRLLIVSEAFDGLSAVERHRKVYGVLADEMRGQIHALGLQTLTPGEWSGPGLQRTESPACLGGSKSTS